MNNEVDKHDNSIEESSNEEAKKEESLLEFASNNDIEGFKLLLDKEGASSINEVGIWYGRQHGSKRIVMDYKTPLMVVAAYGSIDVMKLILSYPEADVNFAYGVNKSTALHCAASGGSVNIVDAVRLLITAGAHVSSVDADGNLPFDVIVVTPKLQRIKAVLEELLLDNGSDNGSVDVVPSDVPSSMEPLAVEKRTGINNSPHFPITKLLMNLDRSNTHVHPKPSNVKKPNSRNHTEKHNMTGLTPPESGSCKKVASMSLAENQLTGALPPEFGNLISLQVLMNKLNGTIPIQISQLQKVVYIEFEPEFSGWTDSV
ncbi:zinc finger CCCH domain-containing protein 30 [Lathyrus oleraceus]|uniref:zinc finger CCCH domain-containing protein 30 n=1 Tax=Pisum sativum TaxID=3888 RepID=UPI0021D3A594|nr:zinc finger CCCH domain-containing protein 30-like [Pisum sativum]